MSSSPDPSRRGGGRAGSLRAAVGVIGELFITAGVVIALFVVYQVWWTDLASAEKQSEADSVLQDRWDNPRSRGVAPSDLPPGSAFARMYIPAFGADYRFAVVAGTDDTDLEIGPGHYSESQDPGRPGNFAIAGHRVGRGAPFNDLDALQACDAIVYETSTDWFVYRVLPIDPADPAAARAQAADCMPADVADRVTSGSYAGLSGLSVVRPDDVYVIDPVPGREEPVGPASLPLTTLTTCHPQYSATERMVVHAVLVRTEPRVPGSVPRELEG